MSLSNLQLAGALKRTQKGDADWYYGGDNEAWPDLASAKAGVPSAIRPGKTVGVFVSGKVVEYWWPDPAHIADSDLIIKSPDLSGKADTSYVDTQDASTLANARSYADAQDTSNLTAAKVYADGLLVSVYKDCGNWAASNGAFPTTGGTGTSGAIKAGNAFEISVAGTIAGEAYDVGDLIRALVDAPGQTLSNWARSEHNTQQATEAERGTAKITDQTTIQTETTTNDTAIVSPKKFWFGWERIKQIAATITGLWNFTGGLQSNGSDVEVKGNKNQNNGYAGLNGTAVDPRQGGTGFSSYTTGDVLYASSSTTLAKLPDVTTGNVLLSGGVGSAPAYGKVNLSTHVSDVLPIANGGTGSSTQNFVDLSSNQSTIGGNKTFTGTTTLLSNTPELRLLTSSDSAYARFQRTTLSSNDLFVGKNQVLQVGGIGKAIKLTGSAQTISFNDTGIIGSNSSFSICFWLKTTTTSGQILTLCPDVGRIGLKLNGNLLQFTFSNETGANGVYNLGTLGTWNHVALTITNGTGNVKVYINGVQSGVGFNLPYNLTTSGGNVIFQASSGGNVTFDQLLVYNTYLPATGTTSVATIYNSGAGTASVPTSGLVRRYELEEGTGSTTVDLSGNNYTATLANAPTWDNNGIVPIAGVSSESTFFSISDGLINSEKGIASWGDYNGRNQQQGKWFQWYQNNAYPLASNNAGQWRFDPNNSSNVVPTILSTVDIAGNLTIGSTSAGTISAPTDGLYVQGQANFAGISNAMGSIPEQRFTTNDSAFGRFQRTTANSNNLFTGKNNVLQVGGVGKALKFNGINQYMTVPNTGVGGNVDFSIAFWFSPASFVSTMGIFQVGTNLLSTMFGLTINNSTTLVYRYQQSTTSSVTLSNPLMANTWHLFVMTYSATGNGTYNLYVDNVNVVINTTNGGTGFNLGGNPIEIGRGGVNGNTTYFNGKIDEPILYNTVLTAGNVSTLWNSGTGTATPPTTGIVRRYPFEEGTGTTTADISGNNYSASLLNGVTWDNNGIVPISGVSSESTFFSVSDGLVNGEKGVATWGDYNGRNQQQGKWFQWFQNNAYPLVSNNNGQWRFDPNRSSSALPTIASTIDVAGNMTIGSTSSGSAAAPTDGLSVDGYIKTNTGIQDATLTTAPTLSLSLISSGGTVTAGTYYYKVVAYDSAGNAGAISNEVSGTVTSGQYNQLRWTVVSGAVRYRLFRYPTSGATTSAYVETTFAPNSGPPGVVVLDNANGIFTGSVVVPTGTGSFVPSRVLTSNGSVFGNSLNVYTGYNATADNQTFVHNQLMSHQVNGNYNGVTSIALDISASTTYSLRVNKDIIPLSNNSINLGSSSSNAFANIYSTYLFTNNIIGLSSSTLLLQNGFSYLNLSNSNGNSITTGINYLPKLMQFAGVASHTTASSMVYSVGITSSVRTSASGQSVAGLYCAPTLDTSGVVLTLSGATVTTGLQLNLSLITSATGGTGSNLQVAITSNSSGVIAGYAPAIGFRGSGYTVGDTVTVTGVPLNGGGTTSISFTVASLVTGITGYSAKFDNGPINLGNTPSTASDLTQILTRNSATGTIEKVNSTAFGQFGRLTGSGDGSSTMISIAHGLSGISSASVFTITALSAASANYSYATADSANINIFYTIAPTAGTNNLLYNLIIKA